MTEELKKPQVESKKEIPSDSPNKGSKNKKPKADTEAKKELSNEPKYLDSIRVGYTVRVFYKILEGEKERIQPFEGVIIARKGAGISQTFTVRRVGAGHIGVERIFPVYSPKIVDVKVVKKSKVRRAKLYYLRNLKGRRESKLKEIKK